MTSNDDVSIQTLVELGLTALQAKIYLATVINQKASVGKIAALSKVARPDIYRVLPVLEKKGLVTKIITSPAVYEATPLKQACDLLLQRKKEEYAKVSEDTSKLIEGFFYRNNLGVHPKDKDEFGLVSSPKLLLEMLAVEDAEAKTSIDVMGYWVHIRPLMNGTPQFLYSALKRGVRIRVITNQPSDKWYEIFSSPQFEMRVFRVAELPKMVIFDQKKANMFVGNSTKDIAPSLWSDNPEFVKVITAYFDNTWVKSDASASLASRKRNVAKTVLGFRR